MKLMNVEWNLNELSLGQVWQVDLDKHEAIIKETLLVAQGENALEEYLRQVKKIK
jgi:dynein heavy chain 1, cytosolic